MKRTDAVREALASLQALAADPNQPGAADALRRALGHRSNLVAARAAEIAAEAGLVELEPELAGVFERFMTDSLRTDPTCAAKVAAAEALSRLDASAVDVYLRGIRHIQPEPVWGGTEDTAAKLRAACALGLATSGHPDTLLELARLLADPEIDARIGAARALAGATQLGALPVLWYKARVGDVEAAVQLEVFTGLLALDPQRALPLVAESLEAVDAPAAEAAALALGESRWPEAFGPLDAALSASPEPSMRRALTLALAMLRTDEAIGRLLDLAARGTFYEQRDALAALDLFRDDALIWERVEAIKRSRR